MTRQTRCRKIRGSRLEAEWQQIRAKTNTGAEKSEVGHGRSLRYHFQADEFVGEMHRIQITPNTRISSPQKSEQWKICDHTIDWPIDVSRSYCSARVNLRGQGRIYHPRSYRFELPISNLPDINARITSPLNDHTMKENRHHLSESREQWWIIQRTSVCVRARIVYQTSWESKTYSLLSFC